MFDKWSCKKKLFTSYVYKKAYIDLLKNLLKKFKSTDQLKCLMNESALRFRLHIQNCF